jgi:hypothetical protein
MDNLIIVLVVGLTGFTGVAFGAILGVYLGSRRVSN